MTVVSFGVVDRSLREPDHENEYNNNFSNFYKFVYSVTNDVAFQLKHHNVAAVTICVLTTLNELGYLPTNEPCALHSDKPLDNEKSKKGKIYVPCLGDVVRICDLAYEM